VSFTIEAPAKINLTLDVVDRRADGYHLIESVMQTVDVCDIIELELCEKEGIVLTCSDETLPTDETNTAYRAAQVFYEHIGQTPHLNIHVEKHIPSMAGMGGESADAAGVLHGLNALEHAGLSLQELCALGSQIGADVPFCVMQGTALAEGVGSILTPLVGLPDDTFIVIGKGEKGVSTKQAYAAIDAAQNRGRYDSAPMIDALCNGSLQEVANGVGNVFDEVLMLPDVGRIKALMRENGALGCSMTGSGSAVFGLFDDKHAASECVTVLKDADFEAFVCQPQYPTEE